MLKTISALLAMMMLAQVALAASPVRREPLKIKSDTLHADNEKKTAVFEGKVVAHQGDMTLYADKVVITYSGEKRDLSQVEAFGNVRIIQGNRQATGGHAVYDTKEARIILDTSPKVVQGDDVITGRIITYYVDEERSVVTGGPKQRVEAVFHPGEQNGSKAKP